MISFGWEAKNNNIICHKNVLSKMYGYIIEIIYDILKYFITGYKIYRKMQKSFIVNEEQLYARFNEQGQTKLVTAKQIQPGYSYRRVHYTREGQWVKNRSSNQIFSDPQYQIDPSELSKLDYKNSKVVLRRLYDLYRHSPKNQKPQFFPTKNFNVNRVKDHSDLPPFVTEIGILPIQHYKSLFLTQDFTSHGLYQIIINQNGRFETDVVDDWIPVYEDTMQPIWSMDMQHAWQIILLKFWAKKNRGYMKVKQIPPFQFIQFFTNSNWKYYNLGREGQYFLEYYTGKIPNGKFVLKTKNTKLVNDAGLIPNSAGYELIDMRQTTGKQNYADKRWVIQVRSTLINKWTGSMSVLDKQVNAKYDPNKYRMALQRDFMINHNDFLNLFSAAFIASRRDKVNYHSGYYLLDVPANNKSAIFLKFNIIEDGWFDFCVKQFDQNRVPYTSNKSRMQGENDVRAYGGNSDGTRFLKVKFILVKDNSTGRGSVMAEPQYNPPRYDVYQIEYLHGYNRGDARFENIVAGTYYLKIKTQKCNRPTRFVVNYACNTRVIMEEVKLSKPERSSILRQAMASLIGQMTSYSLDVKTKYEQIVFANLFEEVGYGFVGVRIKKVCPYRILIDIDPKLVNDSGYKLKNQFKTMTQPFSIIVAPGECTSVVMNKVNPAAKWPPAGIDIYREK